MTRSGFDKLKVDLWVAGSTDQEGDGGWCGLLHCVILGDHHTKTMGGNAKGTTPTRMSLLGVLHGLQLLRRDRPVFVNIHTSIVQVSTGLSKNMYKWAKDNWVTSKGEAPQHLDLWQQIYALLNDPTRVLHYRVILQNEQNMNHPNRLVAIHHANEYLRLGKQQVYDPVYA